MVSAAKTGADTDVAVVVAVITEVPAPEERRGAGVVVTTAVQTGASWLRCAASDAETR